MKYRPMAATDRDRVLALNAASVAVLSPMDEAGFERHLGSAAHALVCEVEGEVAAFALAYGPGSAYDSVNYEWFGERFDDFCYLDRIVVGTRFRRRGIASRLYDEVEASAVPRGRMVCEISSDPPNPASLAFHQRRGYREIGHLRQPDGHQTVMMEKELTR